MAVHLGGSQRAQVHPVFNGCGSCIIAEDLARVGLHVDLLKLGVAVLVGVSLWRCDLRCRRLSVHEFIIQANSNIQTTELRETANPAKC